MKPAFLVVAALLAGLGLGIFSGPQIQQSLEKITQSPPDRLVLAAAGFADLPGWTADKTAEFWPAFMASCAAMLRQPTDKAVGPKASMGTIADWQAPCAAAVQLTDVSDAAVRGFLEAHFQPLQVRNNAAPDGLFTGYYEPELRGSLTRQGRYQTALLRPPADLVSVNLGEFNPKWRGQRIAGRIDAGKLKPLQPRAGITAGALAPEKLELLYVDDPVDAFFLHIQGSGRVKLDDGRVLRAGYAGQNGHPYVAIGKVLLEAGALSRGNVSMQTIRAWLEANPGRVDEILNHNPSYIFFNLSADADPALGPLGAQNLPLTPGRSLAVDLDFHGLGVPVWLDSQAPEASGDTMTPVQRLMLTQDTGGALKGPVRGDVFWGFGPDAAAIAGRMQSQGKLYVLLPKPVAQRIAAKP